MCSVWIGIKAITKLFAFPRNNFHCFTTDLLFFDCFNGVRRWCASQPADGANYLYLAEQCVTCQLAARSTVHLQRGGEFGCFGRAGETLVPRTQQNFPSFKKKTSEYFGPEWSIRQPGSAAFF